MPRTKKNSRRRRNDTRPTEATQPKVKRSFPLFPREDISLLNHPDLAFLRIGRNVHFRDREDFEYCQLEEEGNFCSLYKISMSTEKCAPS